MWGMSSGLIALFFLLFDRENYLTLAASLIGVSSLIFSAKGNPVGQFLMLIFSALYGLISYTFAYYREMISCLGMTAPMALFALISWLKNPYNGNRAEVAAARLKKKELAVIILLTTLVTSVFYFVLAAFNKAYLLPSTVSIATSFFAVCLTYKRSPFFAAAYAANDVVLIILWVLASFADRAYISVVICFLVFLANDIYGFINWTRMQRRQEAGSIHTDRT